MFIGRAKEVQGSIDSISVASGLPVRYTIEVRQRDCQNLLIEIARLEGMLIDDRERKEMPGYNGPNKRNRMNSEVDYSTPVTVRLWPTEERIRAVVKALQTLPALEDVEQEHLTRDGILEDFIGEFAPEIALASRAAEEEGNYYYV